MATGSRYGGDVMMDEGAMEPQRKSSGCVKGCLVVLVILLVLAVVLGFLAYQYGRPWYANMMAEALHQMIDESDLPAPEKAEVKEQVSRVADDFGASRMTFAQLGMIIQKLTESPLMTSIVVSVVDQKYVAQSGLTDVEKAEGRRNLRRFVRGMADQKIPQASIDSAMQHVAVRQPDNTWRLRDNVTDEQLRSFLAAAKEESDKAQIPAEPEDFDPSDEIKKVIDQVMAGGGAGN
jgi:hypothetical protein